MRSTLRPRRTWIFPVCAATACLFVPALCRADMESDLGSMLQHALYGGGLFWPFFISFLCGLATSLTPCVYPLIPITVSLFGARDDEVTRVRALALAGCYVGGIAVMYSSLGVFSALTGMVFGTFMANPYVIVPIALFFAAMAASMFGAFEIGLPTELQGRLSKIGGKGPGGAFLMGLVAGVIAAPCTGPPLAALLAFVATHHSTAPHSTLLHSAVLGGSLLFVYALGMGVLFFAIAGFALKLPRSGAWMDGVKSIFGVVMIVAALYFLRNVVPALHDYGQGTRSFFLLNAGLLGAGVALGAVHLSFHDGLLVKLRKGTGVLLLCVGLFGLVAWSLAPRAVAANGPKLHWLHDEAQAVRQAQAEHKPLLVDFAAEWCLPCKQLELKTFSDPAVSKELARFVLVHIDCTDPDDPTRAVMDRYQAETLPTVVVRDSAGKEALRLKEFAPPERVLPTLMKIN